MKKYLISCLLATILFSFSPSLVKAQAPAGLGIHLLNIDELSLTTQIFKELFPQEQWKYVTVPFTYDDLEKKAQWRHFFEQARQARIKPIIRLATRFEDNSWERPERKKIVEQLEFLGQLNWPDQEKLVIVYNEVNHAAEWGGQVDPTSYNDTLRFASSWAKAIDSDFKILPAGLDLAAPSGSQSLEAFAYLSQMHRLDPEIFSYLDYWNSHSYPNPGFSSSPTRTAKNSLRGFQHELAFLKNKTGRDFEVIITETGWKVDASLTPWLESYYTYALQHIWSDPRVIAVTPFLLKGAPGPFSQFSFVTENNEPTPQYMALKEALEKLEIGS